MTYIIHNRVSTKKQDTETQRVMAMDYIRSLTKGKPFQYMLFEESESTIKKTRYKRHVLCEMLKNVKSGDTVIVYKASRLARDTVEMIQLFREMRAKGARVHSLYEGDIDDTWLGIYGSFASVEAKNISENTRSKLAVKRQKGERISGHIPFGYMLDHENLIMMRNRQTNKMELRAGRLIEDPEAMPAINAMCEAFDQGMTYEQITRHINSLGFVNKAGNPFQKTTVYRCLSRTGRTRPLHPPPRDLAELTCLQSQ